MQNNSTYRIFEDKVDQLFHNGLHDRDLGPEGNDWENLSRRLDEHDRDRRKPGSFNRIALLGLLLLITGALVYTGVQKLGSGKTTDGMAQSATPAGQTVAVDRPQQQTGADGQSGTAALPSNGTTAPVADNSGINEANTEQTGNNNNDAGNATLNNGTRQTAPQHIPALNHTNNNNKPVFTQYRQPRSTAVSKNRTGNQPAQQATAGEETMPPSTMPGVTISAQNQLNSREVINTSGTETTAEKTKIAAADNNSSPQAAAIMNQVNNTTPVTNNNTTKQKKTPAQKQPRTSKEAPAHEFNGQGQWFVEGFAGITRSSKDVQSFAAFLAPAGYLEKRLNQEQPLSALQTGVLFKYRKNHLLLGTGLTYTELGDQVKYDAAYSGVVALGANGRSRLSYIEIPLTAGYEWANKRWGFSLQGGISAAVLLSAKGKYVSTTGFTSQLFSLQDNKNIFRKTVFSVVAAPSVNYYLSDRSNLFISPVYQRNLQPVTKTGAELSQKYSSLGIRFGIRTTLR